MSSSDVLINTSQFNLFNFCYQFVKQKCLFREFQQGAKRCKKEKYSDAILAQSVGFAE